MEVLKYLQDKYNLDYTKASPFFVPMGRSRDIPYMFRRLGFKVGAEIGTYQGAYALDLLKRVPKLKLYCIDLWDNYKGYIDFNSYDKEHLRKTYETTKENVKDYDCVLIKDWSSQAVKQFADESLDFVFIDGNHAYEFVVEDIALWSKKVRKGGVIYGHDFDDYTTRKRWRTMGVVRAVEGWVNSYKIHPWFILANNKYKCWMWVKT